MITTFSLDSLYIAKTHSDVVHLFFIYYPR